MTHTMKIILALMVPVLLTGCSQCGKNSLVCNYELRTTANQMCLIADIEEPDPIPTSDLVSKHYDYSTACQSAENSYEDECLSYEAGTRESCEDHGVMLPCCYP